MRVLPRNLATIVWNSVIRHSKVTESFKSGSARTEKETRDGFSKMDLPGVPDHIVCSGINSYCHLAHPLAAVFISAFDNRRRDCYLPVLRPAAGACGSVRRGLVGPGVD